MMALRKFVFPLIYLLLVGLFLGCLETVTGPLNDGLVSFDTTPPFAVAKADTDTIPARVLDLRGQALSSQ